MTHEVFIATLMYFISAKHRSRTTEILKATVGNTERH